MPRFTYRSRRRAWLRSVKPDPVMSKEYYSFPCTHCHETVFANALDLRGKFGRLLKCSLCGCMIRVFKRTRAYEDKCKNCNKLVSCIATPTVRVGTGTSIKKKKYPFEVLKGHVMTTIHITDSIC
jgi:hypothetical protein